MKKLLPILILTTVAFFILVIVFVSAVIMYIFSNGIQTPNREDAVLGMTDTQIPQPGPPKVLDESVNQLSEDMGSNTEKEVNNNDSQSSEQTKIQPNKEDINTDIKDTEEVIDNSSSDLDSDSDSDSEDLSNNTLSSSEAEQDGALKDEGVPLGDAPIVEYIVNPVASGINVKRNENAVIDYSNTSDGYIMVAWTGDTSKKVKVQSKGPSGVTYTYNINTTGEYEVLPLSDGNGQYKVTIYQNVQDAKYAQILVQDMNVNLKDETAPFIRPNQYVNYKEGSQTVKLAAEKCRGITDNLKKVEIVYDYVVSNITYDTEKAQTVQSGYLPVLDDVLSSKKGICFDYAALMTGMLRSQGVPCKLVVGYAGTAYHAWINVWSETEGWVDNVIFFDGKDWKLMDPTFASSGNKSESIMKYIGNGANYQAKYLY